MMLRENFCLFILRAFQAAISAVLKGETLLRASTCSASKLARLLIKLAGKSRRSSARTRTKSFSRLVELKQTTSRLAEFAKCPNRKAVILLLQRLSIRRCADQSKSWKRTVG